MSASHVVAFPSLSEGESPGDRLRRLQTEARALAREHVELLAATLADVSRLSGEIAQGGDAYPVGVRELSRRLVEETVKHSLTLTAILERA
ncbi:MAG TPA: hypothetical protein VMT68_17920 [Caulobacteraceae bacterium]|nr:hypothetical protein [Caulobacteraceae bacterium]